MTGVTYQFQNQKLSNFVDLYRFLLKDSELGDLEL